MANEDMNTMPMRDLITAIRDRTKKMKSTDILLMLMLNILANRMEQEVDRADDMTTLFSELMTLLDQIEVNGDATLASGRFKIVEKYGLIEWGPPVSGEKQ